MKRVFLIVLDSLGIGELPDAARFSDTGSNTLASILPFCHDRLRALKELDLFAIDGISKQAEPTKARVARLAEKSAGKDTTIGHWELAGIISPDPLPTYPQGFPDEILDKFSRLTGRGILCNRPYSGTEVIRDYGEEHRKSGKWIVYTSADSVFQIAAHEAVIPLSELYSACEIARDLLQEKHGVGRVIARPFVGEFPNFIRTKNRHDYSLTPPKSTLLDYIQAAEMDVIAIGKIRDIFVGRGITKHLPTGSNLDGMRALDEVIETDFNGLCFCNLVDFDMIYGHRNDALGYANALLEFDRWLGTFLPKLRQNDLLIITADHGCDPQTPSTDHSREYVPALLYSPEIEPANLGTRPSFSDVSASVLDFLDLENPFSHATSLLKHNV